MKNAGLEQELQQLKAGQKEGEDERGRRHKEVHAAPGLRAALGCARLPHTRRLARAQLPNLPALRRCRWRILKRRWRG